MSNLAVGFHNRLLQELECPVCMEYMMPPIMLCNNGHNLCCNCRVTLDKCPICRGPFLKVRNVSLENIATETLYPCKNTLRGCTKLLTKNLIRPHADECTFDNHKCPFAKISNTGCNWRGTLDTVRRHVEANHKGSCVQRVSRKFKTVLHNVSCSQRYYQAIITMDELFYVSWRVQSGVFYCAVFYIGPKKGANNFRYRFSISTKDGDTYSASSLTHSYYENVNDVFRHGKCVMLDYSAVQRSCSENKDLPFRMEISVV
ncbi:E3 ubiquitin-protein ligase SIAH1B [Cryptotermes secundus]|uniref:E3 ubiquitin-protein ligase n=1 Tax=Cryptotermes secundus TaxID=105785 RepID=A0A2J7QN54_9NEOP|nr:E3 ubiquitin-protein ligase SIAH1B [Cryptotermes secundus]XP_023711180.1 E3 ubiquitin-protein ligase SIAH1B [Cryptotermes secundus]XP_033608152.1 E3 ubiquitin-protein ligase SIAH1B [Cryptotermes secundus]PNF30020.1 E3 ubiquitin-protein ligase SIAH1B [Cryptotermes secundus]